MLQSLRLSLDLAFKVLELSARMVAWLLKLIFRTAIKKMPDNPPNEPQRPAPLQQAQGGISSPRPPLTDVELGTHLNAGNGHLVWSDINYHNRVVGQRRYTLNRPDGKLFGLEAYYIMGDHDHVRKQFAQRPTHQKPFQLAPLAPTSPSLLPEPDGELWLADSEGFIPVSDVPTRAPE